MKKIYNYKIEEELKQLKDLDVNIFHDFIQRKTLKFNKIVIVHDNNGYQYYCTNCKTWHPCDHIKLKTKLKCAGCGHVFEVISKKNIIKPLEDYITYFETNDRNELICRLFYFEKTYDKNKMQHNIKCFEVIRKNVDRKIAMKANTYYVANYGLRHGYLKEAEWKRDKVSNNCYTDFSNHNLYDIVYTKGLKQIISKTKYKYSAMDRIARHGKIDTLKFLDLWLENPELEIFAKLGKFNIIRDLVYWNISINKVKEISKDKHDMALLKKFDISYKEIRIAKMLKLDDYKYIKLAVKCELSDEMNHTDAVKLLNYLNKQHSKYSEYKDYLRLAAKIGMDVNNKKIRYPKNLKKAHDDVHSKYDDIRNEVLTKNIKEYSEELKKFSFNNQKYIIKPVESQEDLINESKELNHCVRSYADIVARRETAIFFIRKKAKVNEPFVTLELKGEKVIQVRAKNNDTPPPDVLDFVKMWEQKYDLIGY